MGYGGGIAMNEEGLLGDCFSEGDCVGEESEI